MRGTGVREMDADEALGMLGDRGEAGDRDRRGVGADDGVGFEERAQTGEYLAFDLLVLGRCALDESRSPPIAEQTLS